MIGRLADDKSLLPVYGRGVSRFGIDQRHVDAALAVALLAGCEAQIWLAGTADHRRLGPALVAVPLCALVAVRRRLPAFVGVMATAITTAQLAVWGDPQVLLEGAAYFISLYALTVWTSTRAFAGGIAAAGAIGAVTSFTGPHGSPSSAAFFGAVSLVVMLIVRAVLGDRDRRLVLAKRERDLAAREAVVEERARIARELHDAIAHNVSMMVVQAGAERRVLAGEQESTREVLETIEHIGRGALTEMRRLVGMLRSDAPDPLVPQPRLDDLQTLVAQVREAGLPVELAIEGEPRPLPVGIELSAYRIVQEALTNALKHAGDARATVSVRYGPDTIELEIVDDGGGAPAPVAGGGHGLAGMRERVALYGGRFDAGRAPAGGFAVRVLLPVR